MNDLQTIDFKMVDAMMDEYEQVMDTVMPLTTYPLVPSVYDLMNPFNDLENIQTFEDAAMRIIKIAHTHSIFLRHRSDYIYEPIRGVW